MAEGRRIFLTGRTADADTTLEVLAVVRGTLPTNEFVASTASSDNTNDKAAGTGALTATIRGLLKTSLLEDEETIIMNGTSAVVTTKKFVRLNEFRVNTCGTALGNTGTISVSLNSQLQMTIPIGYSRENGLVYAVPADQYLEIDNLTLTGAEYATTNVVRAQLQIRSLSALSGLPWQVIAEADLPFGGSRNAIFKGKIIVPGGYELRVFIATATNNVIVSGNLSGQLVFGKAPSNTIR